MARKDRVPNPPKRPQGPQRRSTPSTGMDPGRRRLLLLLLAGSVVAVAAIVLGTMLRGGEDSTEQRLAAAGCRLITAPGIAGEHIPPSEKPKWNTDPPTSGDQANETVVWGSYEEPVSLRSMIHNLEHGGVYILYGEDVPEAEVAKIQEFYTDDPNGLVLAPLPRLGGTIALGAWHVPEDGPPAGYGKLARCSRFDEGAFSTFVETFGFQGIERTPRELLEPGT